MKRWCALLLVLSLLVLPVLGAEPTLSASSAILMDKESGRVLYEKNAREQRSIASITKLMTALVAVELHPDLSSTVTIQREWTGAEGSSMYLKPEEKVTLEALLYGLMLSSGNDAALSIAGYCGGDVESFVAEMNKKAAQLGMNDTHFANPNGLDDPDHYSTAYDMAILARAVLEREELRAIVSTRSIYIAGRSLTNHNKLLWRYEGCTGLKTGYTDEAGRTLVSSALREGQELIAVTLNAPNDWADHAALFDYGFATYPRTLVAAAGEWADLPVTGSLCPFTRVSTVSDFYYPLAQGETVQRTVDLPQRVEAPVEAGFPAGSLTLTLNGDEIGRLSLLYQTGAANNVAPLRWWQRLFG
ncbi:D-alanyl-D-alanine carboxypeptidase family protein [uncultured Flavonifractor sp.]|uniref:D-alanyl-D-alanine carboxypeptidase n=1 Tax=Candidatus Flavonifractor intestinigallinarum TaxID=2838586 RepID=A0A9D2MKU2_9FIRM|nr:D-alanyl-D-alanine carboxypeptidase family protein [uncultured Flavonifractor sp.]HJB80002.1 D-alanyl-D-alanine carboxypeptidase [Candidatus Flavonifractor intestinigallinarum]